MLEDTPILVDVFAQEACQILFLAIGLLRHPPLQGQGWTGKIISNLLTISTRKNLILSERNFLIMPKRIRDRVMAYLNSMAIQKGKKEFVIPFDRQQMADYLNVERSALSKELGQMKKEGWIDFHKNHFVVKKGDR